MCSNIRHANSWLSTPTILGLDLSACKQAWKQHETVKVKEPTWPVNIKQGFLPTVWIISTGFSIPLTYNTPASALQNQIIVGRTKVSVGFPAQITSRDVIICVAGCQPSHNSMGNAAAGCTRHRQFYTAPPPGTSIIMSSPTATPLCTSH